MDKNSGRKFFLTGLVIFLISYLLPVDLLNTFTNLKPTGLTSLFVCPIIGLMGMGFSMKEKDRPFVVLNLLLILLLPLAMFAASALGGWKVL